MRILRRRSPLPLHVKVSNRAAAAMRSAADQAYPSETGGVLIGWRDDDCVHIDLAVEVRDPAATHTSYDRDHGLAQAAIDKALDGQPVGSPVGYAGDWHTHPAACGPSPTDVASIERVGSGTRAPVALLVVVRESPARWTLAARVAHRRRSRSATVTEEAEGST